MGYIHMKIFNFVLIFFLIKKIDNDICYANLRPELLSETMKNFAMFCTING